MWANKSRPDEQSAGTNSVLPEFAQHARVPGLLCPQLARAEKTSAIEHFPSQGGPLKHTGTG